MRKRKRNLPKSLRGAVFRDVEFRGDNVAPVLAAR